MKITKRAKTYNNLNAIKEHKVNDEEDSVVVKESQESQKIISQPSSTKTAKIEKLEFSQ
jgi:hypothetical protein